MNTISIRFLVERVQRVSHGVIGHQWKNSAWIGGEFKSAWQLDIGPEWKAVYAYIRTFKTREGSSSPYSNTGDRRLHQSIPAPLSACMNSISCIREGKRTAEGVSEAPDTKKARRDGDKGALAASATEFSTPKRSTYLRQIHHGH